MGFFSGLLDSAMSAVTDDPFGTIGGIIDAGGSLLGGVSKNNANKANMAMAQQQLAYQEAYAKNRLQWQVEDAKKAGLHPMVAAGLSPVSFSPVSAQQEGVDWLGDTGQNMMYASAKAKDREQQAEAWSWQQRMMETQQTGLELDNELKVMEILSMMSRLQNSGPAAPASTPNELGQADIPTGLVSPKSSSYHVWKMGENEYDINLNPDYQATLGDEFGQVINAIKSAARPDIWINPHDGVSYVYNPDIGYFHRLDAMSNEEVQRLLGNDLPPSARTGRKYPRDKMNRLDRSFFDWVDDIFN